MIGRALGKKQREKEGRKGGKSREERMRGKRRITTRREEKREGEKKREKLGTLRSLVSPQYKYINDF